MCNLRKAYILLLVVTTVLGSFIIFSWSARAATLPEHSRPTKNLLLESDDEFLYLPLIVKARRPTLTIDSKSFIHDGMYSVVWSSVDGVTDYMLVEDDNPEFSSPEVVYEGPDLFWPGINKPCGVPIYYRVKGVAGEEGETGWSDSVSIIPQIELTNIPPRGSNSNLEGRVCPPDSEEYKVAVYILVNGWWTKPYWNRPWTTIGSDNTWRTDITTGGNDLQATRIVAFLVPENVPPLLCGGSYGSCLPLPPLMYPHVIVTRD